MPSSRRPARAFEERPAQLHSLAPRSLSPRRAEERPGQVRVLALADSHLGLTRSGGTSLTGTARGEAQLASYLRALARAERGDVDAVVHLGDLFNRSRPPFGLVERAFAPLTRLAARGIPVVVIPGNHDRSRVAAPLLARHPLLRVLNEPGTVVHDLRGVRVAFTGFPYVRRGVRDRFSALLDEAGLAATAADVRLLCMHQLVAGSSCGPRRFVFREGDDVVRGADLPGGVAVVLTGHVHRHQVLRWRLDGEPLPAVVLYPGATERTSLAERGEIKGYLCLDLAGDGTGRGRLVGWRFHPLPSAPLPDARRAGARASRSERVGLRGAPARGSDELGGCAAGSAAAGE